MDMGRVIPHLYHARAKTNRWRAPHGRPDLRALSSSRWNSKAPVMCRGRRSFRLYGDPHSDRAVGVLRHLATAAGVIADDRVPSLLGQANRLLGHLVVASRECGRETRDPLRVVLARSADLDDVDGDLHHPQFPPQCSLHDLCLAHSLLCSPYLQGPRHLVVEVDRLFGLARDVALAPCPLYHWFLPPSQVILPAAAYFNGQKAAHLVDGVPERRPNASIANQRSSF